jgi:hypothetical protein
MARANATAAGCLHYYLDTRARKPDGRDSTEPCVKSLPFACASVFGIHYTKHNNYTMVTTEFKSSRGRISRHRCLLRRGIVKYAVIIRNNSIVLGYSGAADFFIEETADFLNTTAPQSEDLVFGRHEGESQSWEYTLERLFAEEQVFVRIVGASDWDKSSRPCDPRQNNTKKTDAERFYGSHILYHIEDYIYRDPMPVSIMLLNQFKPNHFMLLFFLPYCQPLCQISTQRFSN